MRILVLGALLCFPAFSAENVDLSVIHQIKDEAFERSKVMDTLSNLSDRYGPRLAGSPEFKEAADWATHRLNEYKLENVHLEKWPFGRSWSLQKYAVEMMEPRYSLLAAMPLAWSRPTNGPVSGELMLTVLSAGNPRMNPKAIEADIDRYMEKYKGKLRGKIVLMAAAKRDVTAPELKAELTRYTDAELAAIASAPAPFEHREFDPKKDEFPADPAEAMRIMLSMPAAQFMTIYQQVMALRDKLNQFLSDEGVVAVIRSDDRAHDGMTFAEQAGSYKVGAPVAPATFVVTAEHYNRLVRLLEMKAPVKMQVNLQAAAGTEPVDGYNIVGEIPGTSKKDEIVMLGAHFDSWHSGTGATDNGAGSAVMIEVVRILQALNVKPARTIRIALWGGEEEGLLGSEAYVKEHFGDPKTMRLTSAHAKLAGYFNLDNGSGKIRGVYLQGNDAMRPIFEQWLAPFRDQGVSTISIRNTGGTDHLSFDAVGLPGFQFIQDPLDYSTVTHHSNMDTFDHAQAGDLMQASAVIASCVWEAANRPEMLPRKPLPKAEK